MRTCRRRLRGDWTEVSGARNQDHEPHAVGLLVVLSVLWGGAFFFVGVAVVELPPLTVVLARVGIAAAILLGLTLFLGHSLPRTLSAWMPFLVMGLLNNAVPFSFLNAGQTMVSVGLASIINGMTPLFTALVMASFREERLTMYRAVGVLLGVAGVVLISRPDADMTDARLLGIGLCLAATLSYGFAALWGRRHLADVPPLKSATCQLLSSTLIMTIVVAIVDRPWTLAMPSTEVWMALVRSRLVRHGHRLRGVLRDPHPCRSQQRDACHAIDPGDGATARQHVPCRTNPRVRDRWCGDNRLGAVVDRRPAAPQGNACHFRAIGRPWKALRCGARTAAAGFNPDAVIESYSRAPGGDRSPRTAPAAAVVDQAGGEAHGRGACGPVVRADCSRHAKRSATIRDFCSDYL